MAEMKLTLNVLLSLIIQSKKTGSGKLGNGRLLVKLLQIIADNKGEERTHERNILACFNNDVNKQDSYHKIDKKIGRFLPQGHYYPYENLTFTEFEKCIGNSEKFNIYLRKMESACDEIINCKNLDSLVYTLLVILHQDNNIKKILYGSEFITKDKIFGNYANPKRICVEALLLGLLYHVHKNPDEAEKVELFDAPVRKTFQVVRFSYENSLNFELPIGIIENICEGTKHQKSAELKYHPELRYENEKIETIPEQGNTFLYGAGGTGKSTILMNYICNENTVNFYFSLYQYKKEIHGKIRSESCWILLNILLKYHYQYEYRTYETCTVGEGENAVLYQMTVIDRELRANPDNLHPKYVLLLDGMNDISLVLHETFINELTYIISEWKNVRVIISGRIVPQQYDLFQRFKHIELCGIRDSELKTAVAEIESDYDAINDEDLMEILKIPIFLKIYLESHKNGNKKLNKCGEVIDSYIMNWNDIIPDGGVVRFIVQFALPLVCKRMLEYHSYARKQTEKSKDYVYRYLIEFNTNNEITRQRMLDAVDKAIELYIRNEQVYQNIVAPRRINRETLLKSREKDDFIELIINNISFVEVSYSEPYKLHFTQKFYRDYFAAKHILNAIEAVDIGYRSEPMEETVEYIRQAEIDSRWFYSCGCDFEDNYDALRMIGEISGDYKNNEENQNRIFYQKTLLDSFLDINYGIPDSCAADNIIRVMWISRNQVISEVNFSNQTFQCYLPTYANFSCDFSEARIFNIQLFDFEDNYSYAVSGDLMLIVFNPYGNVVLWNMQEKCIIKEYSIFKSIAKKPDCQNIYYEEISDDGKYFKALSDFAIMVFELETGKLIKMKKHECMEIDDEFDQFETKYRMKYNSIEKLSVDFLIEVVSQMNIFRGCDFQGAMFYNTKEKEMLNKMGAYCDMEEDNYIEESYWSPNWKWGKWYW